ncbi:MAG: hypothetical protein AAGI88_02545 [Pseudomonadota bacterium]
MIYPFAELFRVLRELATVLFLILVAWPCGLLIQLAAFVFARRKMYHTYLLTRGKFDGSTTQVVLARTYDEGVLLLERRISEFQKRYPETTFSYGGMLTRGSPIRIF